MTQEVLAELTDCEANRLKKWGSLWLDLLHVDLALHERETLPNTLATAVTRRALWESAVVSYGRMGASDKRNVEYEQLLDAAGDEEAKAFHAEVMRWRHGHVAHRTDKAYEETATVATHADGHGSDPEALNLLISTWIGPADDSPVARQFRQHANALRVKLWERYLAPIGETIVNRHRETTVPAPPFTGFKSEAERLVATCTLWARSNGTGMPE
jgi:hypothetical protein